MLNGNRTIWIDMEGSDYTEADDRRVRAPQAASPERRHLPPGVPEANVLGHRAAAAARAAHPAGQGRLCGAEARSPTRRAARSTRTTSPCASAMLGQAQGGPSAVPGHGYARRPTDRAGGRPRAVGRAGARMPSTSRCSTAFAPISSASSHKAGFTRARAHRVRRLLVSVVHAQARRAAGERRLRRAPDAAVVTVGQ